MFANNPNPAFPFSIPTVGISPCTIASQFLQAHLGLIYFFTMYFAGTYSNFSDVSSDIFLNSLSPHLGQTVVTPKNHTSERETF